jgi:hypothetical protein
MHRTERDSYNRSVKRPMIQNWSYTYVPGRTQGNATMRFTRFGYVHRLRSFQIDLNAETNVSDPSRDPCQTATNCYVRCTNRGATSSGVHRCAPIHSCSIDADGTDRTDGDCALAYVYSAGPVSRLRVHRNWHAHVLGSISSVLRSMSMISDGHKLLCSM